MIRAHAVSAAVLGTICATVTAASTASAQEGLSPDGVEALVEESAPWFERFERWISSGVGADELGGVIGWSAPAATSDEWIERADSLLVIRSYDEQTVPIEPADWRRRIVRGRVIASELEVAAKVIGVEEAPGGDAMLDVRIEVVGVRQFGLPPVWQTVARAKVLLGREGDGFGARSIRLTSFERAQLDNPYLRERTKGVFVDAPEAAKILGVGMDRWASRLDDPALSAWFGHQGLASDDVNGDGLPDLYVAMPSGLPNMLFLQKADGTVIESASEWGVAWLDDTKGIVLADVDGDGDSDFVSALGNAIVVQTNEIGDEESTEKTTVRGWCKAPDEASFYSIAVSDLDDDDELEIYGTRYVKTKYADSVPVPFDDARNGPSNHLFAFEDGEYVDVTEEWGLDVGGGRFSLAATFVSIEGQRRDALYVVNDFGRNQLFTRAGDRFVDRAEESGVADPGAGMGAAWADYNRDGHVDLYVTNMYSSAGRRVTYRPSFAEGRKEESIARIRALTGGNSLFAGTKGKTEFERANDARVEMGRWGWGGIFTDLDVDGYADILVPAGFLTGPKPGDL